MKEKEREETALFRYKVIATLLDAPKGALFARIRELSQCSWKIPGTARTHIAPTTIYDWLQQYRHGGFEALRPKMRTDRSRPRRLEPEVIEALLGIKQSQPLLSVRKVISEAYRQQLVASTVALPSSTVHRLFAREGLMAKSGPTTVQDMRRFAYQLANEMWQSDVLHGPKAKDDRGRWRKTYLIALLDDATRVIAHAGFAFSEAAGDFLPILRTAFERRGLPKKLFVDNGATYRSKNLQIICARLGVAMIHARPYSPTSKGKVERWLRTVRMQLLPTLTDADLSSLEALNGRLRSWIEGEYHHTPHHGLNRMTPLDQWAQCASEVRYADASVDLYDMFLFETERRVRKDRTVQFQNRIYEVDAALVGETVTLRYDPAAVPGRPLLVRHKGKAAGEASLIDLHANARVKRARPYQSLSFSELKTNRSDPKS